MKMPCFATEVLLIVDLPLELHTASKYQPTCSMENTNAFALVFFFYVIEKFEILQCVNPGDGLVLVIL